MTRYAQFCALARAAELLGERWTLLIVRDLLLGPKRFTDLRATLPGVSASVLAGRLAGLERRGLIQRRRLAPPAAAVAVYELSRLGRDLQPALHELIKWGGRFLLPPRRGEHFEPEWMAIALAACARRQASPARSYLLRIRHGRKEATVHVRGGADGTTVRAGGGAAETTLVGGPVVVLGLMSGALTPEAALARPGVEVSGDRAALAEFRRLFDVGSPAMPASAAASG